MTKPLTIAKALGMLRDRAPCFRAADALNYFGLAWSPAVALDGPRVAEKAPKRRDKAAGGVRGRARAKQGAKREGA